MFGRKNPELPVNQTFQFAEKKALVSPIQEQEQMRAKAKVFVEESRSRMINAQKKIQDFEGGYWFYGYFLSSMSLTMLASLAIGARAPIVSRYAGWISLIGGYGGATGSMFGHRLYLTKQFRTSIEQEIALAQRLDQETGSSMGEYQLEAKRLQLVLDALSGKLQQQSQMPEETAHEIAARYAKKMNWNMNKEAQK